MFVGAINSQVRSILSQFGQSLTGQPVYVGCSGNFTVERVLSKKGVTDLHSNDVSLYSCAVGSYMAGEPIQVDVADDELSWMAAYMEPGLPTIATLLLCSEVLKHYQRPEPYHCRMWKAYCDRFDSMHGDTLNRVKAALDGVTLSSFWPGDVTEFIERAPEDAPVVCFPPTYKGGYERLYKVMDRVFSWDAPSYTLFDKDRFQALTKLITSRPVWMTLRDQREPDMEHCLRGMVQTGLRSRPVYVYSSANSSVLMLPAQRVEAVPLPRLEGETSGVLSFCRITQAQLNELRSEYLSPSITPSGAQVSYGVKVGDGLIGALAFSRSSFYGEWCDAYMLTDPAIRPTVYKRLSKLVLAAAVSQEMKVTLEQALNMPVRTVGTTAFTERAVSMKYRGLFDLHSRKEGRLNYVARAGQWTLEEGLEWWQENHSQQ